MRVRSLISFVPRDTSADYCDFFVDNMMMKKTKHDEDQLIIIHTLCRIVQEDLPTSQFKLCEFYKIKYCVESIREQPAASVGRSSKFAIVYATIEIIPIPESRGEYREMPYAHTSNMYTCGEREGSRTFFSPPFYFWTQRIFFSRHGRCQCH